LIVIKLVLLVTGLPRPDVNSGLAMTLFDNNYQLIEYWKIET